MTPGGNTRRRAIMWSAVACFVIAILCAVQSMTGGGSAFKAFALVAFAAGFIMFVGFWAAGLAPRADDDAQTSELEDEWATAIK